MYIKIVRPTLAEYRQEATEIAQRHGHDSFLMLRDGDIKDRDDRFKFQFIRIAVGDLLGIPERPEDDHAR